MKNIDTMLDDIERKIKEVNQLLRDALINAKTNAIIAELESEFRCR